MEILSGFNLILLFIIIIWLFILNSDYADFKDKINKKTRDIELYQAKKLDSNAIIEDKTKDAAVEKCLDESKKDAKKEEKQPEAPIIASDKNIEKTQEKAPEKAPEKAQNNGIEGFFMGNLFVKIGACAVIVACLAFLKYMTEVIEFSPLLKISAAFTAGVLMLVFALFMHKNEKLKNYSEILMGTGFGVLFACIYCSIIVFENISNLLVSVSALALLGLSYFISNKIKAFSTFAIGLFGAYLNPLVLHNMPINFVFGYLIFLNLISMIFVSENKDKSFLNYINIIWTTINLILFAHKGDLYMPHFPIILFALYLLYDLINYKNVEKNFALSWLNSLSLYAFFAFSYFVHQRIYLVGAMCVCVLIYFAISAIFAKKNKAFALQYLNGAYGSLLLAIFCVDGHCVYKMWAFAFVGLISAIAYKIKPLSVFQNWSVFFFIVSMTNIFNIKTIKPFSVSNIENYVPFLNKRTLLYAVPLFSSWLSLLLWGKKYNGANLFLRFFTNIFLYTFLISEALIIIEKLGHFGIIRSNNVYYLSFASSVIFCFIFALQNHWIYKCSQKLFFKLFGYLIYYIATLMTIFSGFFAPDSIYIPIVNIRFLLLMIPIIIALFYKKENKKDFYGYFAIFLGFILLNFEGFSLIKEYVTNNIGALLTCFWFIYAGGLMLLGIFANIKTSKISGITIILFALMKLLFFDLAEIETILKFVIFITLGSILLIVSYFWAKYSRNK